MRQLSLFTPAELAGMRDRTASRDYSPGRDEFRREHQRHRVIGLARRHAERLRRLRSVLHKSTGEHRRARPAASSAPAPAPAVGADVPSAGERNRPDQPGLLATPLDARRSTRTRRNPRAGDHAAPSRRPASARPARAAASPRYPMSVSPAGVTCIDRKQPSGQRASHRDLRPRHAFLLVLYGDAITHVRGAPMNNTRQMALLGVYVLEAMNAARM
jgi:hypothetical protein